MLEKQQDLSKGSEPKKKVIVSGDPGEVWTTVFEIDPDEALAVQRILNTLRAPEPKAIDPKIIEEEAEELWRPDSD
jgi:hypothetical protein